jgi:hypothetical protein
MEHQMQQWIHLDSNRSEQTKVKSVYKEEEADVESKKINRSLRIKKLFQREGQNITKFAVHSL